MKINVRGLKFQNWLYLMTFSVIILAVLWVLQFIFLGSFYESMKLNEIRSIGDRITNQFNDADFHTFMNEYAFKNNLRIIMLDETGRMTWNFDGFPTDSPTMLPPGGYGAFPQNYLSTALQRLRESNSNRAYFLDTNSRLDITQAVYITRVYDGAGRMYYLYISSPVPSIDSTVSVLKTQFILVTIILFGLSIVAALLISRKMSKPIISLTRSAQRLVKGELDTKFYNEGFTEIHQLASAMNYATGELRSLDKYRKEFIANVSHDLKTPLTIIKLNGELIKTVSENDPQKRDGYCDTIIVEADRLTDMVGEILELSKLESNRAEIAHSRLNISQSLADVLESFQALVVKDGYSFTVDVEEDLYVLGNEPMLRRALNNLISNAINFTGEDKRVFIVLRAVGERVRFEVTDTGEGIPEHKQSVIWDRYYKSDEAHKRAVVGSGLGLSIVKSVIVLLGGECGVISEPGCELGSESGRDVGSSAGSESGYEPTSVSGSQPTSVPGSQPGSELGSECGVISEPGSSPGSQLGNQPRQGSTFWFELAKV